MPETGKVRRILVEYTYYTLQSPEALKTYEQYYLARKAFLTGRLPRDAWRQARQAWEEWKEHQRYLLAIGAPVGLAIPQPLTVVSREGYALDLNDEREDRLAWCLEAFLPGDDADGKRAQAAAYAAKITARRRETGTLTGVGDLRQTLPGWLLQKLETGWRRYLAKQERDLDAEITRRRTLRGYGG